MALMIGDPSSLERRKYMSLESKLNNLNMFAAKETHLQAAGHSDAASSAHYEATRQLQAGHIKQAEVYAAVAHSHSVQAHELSTAALAKTTKENLISE
jgi:hypothetical protein